jgi:hypothetical protein
LEDRLHPENKPMNLSDAECGFRDRQKCVCCSPPRGLLSVG